MAASLPEAIIRRLDDSLRYAILFVLCAVFRFVQVVPNIEPVMATMLPVSKRFGGIAGFVFSFLAIALFDLASGRAGEWTLYTGAVYGVVGFLAASYLSSRNADRWNFLKASVAGTILFDLATALIFGIQFGQSLEATLIGQMPFTAYHLAGNIILVLVFTPFLYRYVALNDSLSLSRMLGARPAPLKAE